MGFFKKNGYGRYNDGLCMFTVDKSANVRVFLRIKITKSRFFSSTSCWIPSPELSVCHAKLKGKRHAKSARYDRNSQSGFERLKRQACNGWRDCTEYAPDARTLPVNTDAACDSGVI